MSVKRVVFKCKENEHEMEINFYEYAIMGIFPTRQTRKFKIKEGDVITITVKGARK